MKFTIVTPSYNQVAYIRDTIESVLNQTYSDYEYIVVDGGSTDGTNEILRSYEHRLSKLVIEPDRGQADAINKGMRLATGDICAYLNSDDYYFRDTLEKVAKYFEDHPDADVIYGDCVFTDENSQFLRYFSEISAFDKDRLINYTNFIMQPSTFWRRTIFEEYGPFDEHLHYGLDWALWCEFAINDCNFYYVPAVLAANREYGETKTSSGGGMRLAELKSINNKYKTTTLPGAYFCFAYAELKSMSRNTLWEGMKMIMYFLLSCGNIISRFKNCENKIINGLYPHSRYLKKRARLCMPYLSSYSVINISLMAPGYPNQSVQVSNRGKLLGCFSFENGSLEIELDMTGFSGDVDVFMKFEAEYTREVRIIDKLKNPCAPKNVAAELLDFNIR